MPGLEVEGSALGMGCDAHRMPVAGSTPFAESERAPPGYAWEREGEALTTVTRIELATGKGEMP